MLETVEKYFFVSLNTNHKEARAKWFDKQQVYAAYRLLTTTLLDTNTVAKITMLKTKK